MTQFTSQQLPIVPKDPPCSIFYNTALKPTKIAEFKRGQHFEDHIDYEGYFYELVLRIMTRLVIHYVSCIQQLDSHY